MHQVNTHESLHRLRSKLDKFREDRFVVFCEIHMWLRKFLEMEKVGGWESSRGNITIPYQFVLGLESGIHVTKLIMTVVIT